jgi:hypothetical protein
MRRNVTASGTDQLRKLAMKVEGISLATVRRVRRPSVQSRSLF